MSKKRFSKATVLEELDKRVSLLVAEHKFDKNNGTSQLGKILDKEGEAMLARAVEYGRMRAYEDFANAVCEGFKFDEA